jgi:hypothetical protein
MITSLRRLMWRRHALIGSDNPRVGRRPAGDRLVFVGGVPRCGTTLLQHVLDSHPAVFGGPEFDVTLGIVDTWRRTVMAHETGRIRAYCSREQIDAAYVRLIEDLLLPAAAANGAELVSEKTPSNVLVFADLLELFPKGRAIHMVRDPRAVVSSMLKVGARCRVRGVRVPAIVQDTQSAVRHATNALAAGSRAEQLFPERVLTLTYEALVTDPETTARRVCAFLGVAFDGRMLEPHAVKHPAQDDLAALDNGTWLDPALGYRAIERSRIRVWEDDLRPADRDVVNAAFRDNTFLHALGYRFD